MQLVAHITRHIAVADEVIEVEVDNIWNVEMLQARVLAACAVMDARAHTQMQRLFEDTQLTDQLSLDERMAASDTAALLFPVVEAALWLLASHAKWRFTKTLPAGEHLVIGAEGITSLTELELLLQGVWHTIDSRLQVGNGREMACQEYTRTLPYDTRLKVAKVLGILYGQTDKAQVINAFKQEALVALESLTANGNEQSHVPS